MGSANTSAIVVAAGASQRFKKSLNRALKSKALFFFQGRPLIQWALENIRQIPISEIAVVVSEDLLDEFAHIVDRGDASVKLVVGGSRRQDSVRRGLEALSPCRFVLVHDAARPIISISVLERMLIKLESCEAVVPTLPITDTLMSSADTGALDGAVDRSRLWRVQTPQGFGYEKLKELHNKFSSGPELFTDDASLFLKEGIDVQRVEGDPLSLKITQSEDIKILEALQKCGRT